MGSSYDADRHHVGKDMKLKSGKGTQREAY